MPQGSTPEWKFDICCEFDCSIEYAKKNGADCKGDFTKPPCIFNGEHKELNLGDPPDMGAEFPEDYGNYETEIKSDVEVEIN